MLRGLFIRNDDKVNQKKVVQETSLLLSLMIMFKLNRPLLPMTKITDSPVYFSGPRNFI